MPTSVGTRRAPRKGKTGLGHLNLHLAPAYSQRYGLEGCPSRGYRVGMDETDHSSSHGEHPIDEKVLSLMDGRLEAARRLADRASELAAARERLAEAQRAYSDSYKDARKAGWEVKELSGHLGLEEPDKPPRRRAAPRKTSPSKSTAEAEQSDEGGTADR